MSEDLGGERGGAGSAPGEARSAHAAHPVQLTAAQFAYLHRGLAEPGGKLPLFDRDGRRYPTRTIRSCIDQGWAEPWFRNPIKPDWLICRLTAAGRAALATTPPAPAAPQPRRPRPAAGCDARRLQRLVRDRIGA